jgi:hypothetical protein
MGGVAGWGIRARARARARERALLPDLEEEQKRVPIARKQCGEHGLI